MDNEGALELVQELVARRLLARDEYRRIHDIEAALGQWLADTGATERSFSTGSETYVLKVKTTVDYDPHLLTALWEYEEIPTEKLEAAQIHRPATTTWHKGRLNNLRKYGARVVALLERASYPATQKIEVESTIEKGGESHR